MRKLLATAAAVAILAPAAAMAESADSLQIQMNGTVEDVCTVAFTGAAPDTTGLNNFSVVNVDIAGDTAQVFGEVIIQNSDDPSNASIGDIDNFSVEFRADFFCNGDYQATIASANGAFVNADAVTNTEDFSNRLGYSINTSFDANGGVNPSLTLTADGSAGSDSEGPIDGSQHNGEIVIELTSGQGSVIDEANATTSGAKNLISGLYEEAMTISFVQDGTVPAAAFSAAAPAQATFSN